MPDLIKLPEPKLSFRFGATMEDPRDGLALFGPLDDGHPYGMRVGVVGTSRGIELYRDWVRRIQRPIRLSDDIAARPMFPGFEAVYGIPWPDAPALSLEVAEQELAGTVYLRDRHQRVFRTVEVFAERIIAALQNEETTPDLWFVVIPQDVYQYCRPQSSVESDKVIPTRSTMNKKLASSLLVQASLFTSDHEEAQPYYYDVDFHNQLKARLLAHRAPTQVIREPTLEVGGAVAPDGESAATQLAIAWNLTSSSFYKAGGRPWKASGVRDGVCYVGLVFKEEHASPDRRSACCAAQMFVDSGDGFVFRGAVGPWRTGRRGDFHLSHEAAAQLVSTAIQTYARERGAIPRELFVHGKVAFDDEEWAGFLEAAGEPTRVTGVRIRNATDLKLFRKGSYPILRGLAYMASENTGYLWTRGYTPRLQTYPGREVPRPLLVDVCRGEFDLPTVLGDVMALTKLNYNACIHSDGMPVTLRFADAVGEILTAGPIAGGAPLPFKHYI